MAQISNLDIWMSGINADAAKLRSYMGRRDWLPPDYSWVAIDQRTPDTRLCLFDLKTGRVIAACVNHDALHAAQRLLGAQ